MTFPYNSLALLLSLALAACGGDPGTEPQSPSDTDSAAPESENASVGKRDNMPAAPSGSIMVEGRIENGVECPLIHTPDGDLYALALGEADFGPGDYVRITGDLVDMSICQQGKGTIEPSRIDSIESPARDRDPARAGGLAVTSDYVRGSWVAKGLNADCERPDFQITANRNGGSVIETRVNGVPATGYVDVGKTPSLQWNEGIPTLPIETRGPDGLAVMPGRGKVMVILAGTRIEGDGAVFVKCA